MLEAYPVCSPTSLHGSKGAVMECSYKDFIAVI